MLKLLKFEIKRIYSSVFFWIVTGFSFIWPILTAVIFRLIYQFEFSAIGEKFSTDFLDTNTIRGLTWAVSVAFITELPKFIALFTCIHLGRDYTDGIIRNKIIAGHSRISIFGSYILSQVAASTFFCVVYILAALLGLTVAGFGVDLHHGEMLGRLATGIVVFLVMTVAFSVIALSFRKRALPLILCILIAIVSNGVGSVIGMYNCPRKACKDYIDFRAERYEEMVDNGEIDERTVRNLEKDYGMDYYLGTPWKIFHPVYVISPFGFEGDYSTGGTSYLLPGSGEYENEIDFSDKFAVDGDVGADDLIQLLLSSYGDDRAGITVKDLKKVKSMHMPYSTLNWIYVGKSLIWIAAIGGWGFAIFRKKNLF